MARKARGRIAEKIQLYDDLLEEGYHGCDSSGGRFKVLDKVWFITTKPVVMRFIQRMIETTSRHPLCYRVDFYDEIVPKAAVGAPTHGGVNE